MQYLSQEIQNDIRWHALDEYPNECCGIIVEQNDKSICINCDNVSADKQLSFEISGKDYLKAQSIGDIKAYYHSHPNDKIGKFSPCDKAISKSHGVPLILFSMLNNKFIEYNS